MDDTISRQAAIDGFYEMASDMDHLCTVSDYASFLESLPSAQPEVIDIAKVTAAMAKEADLVAVTRCKDCKWWSKSPLRIDRRCSVFNVDTGMTFFCKHGRRENE